MTTFLRHLIKSKNRFGGTARATPFCIGSSNFLVVQTNNECVKGSSIGFSLPSGCQEKRQRLRCEGGGGKHRKLRDRKIDLLLALQAQPDLPLTFPETHKHKSLGLIHKHMAANNTVTLEYNTQENVHL